MNNAKWLSECGQQFQKCWQQHSGQKDVDICNIFPGNSMFSLLRWLRSLSISGETHLLVVTEWSKSLLGFSHICLSRVSDAKEIFLWRFNIWKKRVLAKEVILDEQCQKHCGFPYHASCVKLTLSGNFLVNLWSSSHGSDEPYRHIEGGMAPETSRRMQNLCVAELDRLLCQNVSDLVLFIRIFECLQGRWARYCLANTSCSLSHGKWHIGIHGNCVLIPITGRCALQF